MADMKTPNEMYVDGKWVAADDGARQEIVDPATEEVVDSVPVATDADLESNGSTVPGTFFVQNRSLP